MAYRCVKGFSLPKCDDDGFETEEYMVIMEDTIWHVPEDSEFRIVGGEVRLESDDLGWIEMSIEILDLYFERIN